MSWTVYFGGRSSPLSQPTISPALRGSSPSHCEHRSERGPLPPGPNARVISEPHCGHLMALGVSSIVTPPILIWRQSVRHSKVQRHGHRRTAGHVRMRHHHLRRRIHPTLENGRPSRRRRRDTLPRCTRPLRSLADENAITLSVARRPVPKAGDLENLGNPKILCLSGPGHFHKI